MLGLDLPSIFAFQFQAKSNTGGAINSHNNAATGTVAIGRHLSAIRGLRIAILAGVLASNGRKEMRSEAEVTSAIKMTPVPKMS